MTPRQLRRAMLGAGVSLLALPSLAARADAGDLPAIWASARNASVERTIDAPDAVDASARTPSDDTRERDAAARIDADKSYAIPALEIIGFEILLNQTRGRSITSISKRARRARTAPKAC